METSGSEVPYLAFPDGRPLPRRWTGPPGMQRLWRRLVARLLAGRLPPMVASYRDGRRFHVPAEETPMYVQIFRLGEFEPLESRAVRQLLRRGDFAIDVGANHGWHSILMAACVGPDGAVWAIEPVPAVLQALRENLALNPGIEVDVVPVALGASDGRVDLHVFAGLPDGHASTSTFGRDDYLTYETERRTLDGLLAEADRSPALVKLDAEGAELEVLQGAAGLIAAMDAPCWMIDVNVNTSAAFGLRPVDLLEPFDGHGYEVLRLTPAGLVPDLEPASAPHGSMWVCVPPARRDRLTG